MPRLQNTLRPARGQVRVPEVSTPTPEGCSMRDLLQQIAEKIAGPYHTPSEGAYDQARDMVLMVTEWLKTEPFAGGIDAAMEIERQLRQGNHEGAA